MFEIVIASFQIENKLGKTWFFQETFLLADFNIDMILKMLFLNFNNVNIQFARKKLTKRYYTTAETLSTT